MQANNGLQMAHGVPFWKLARRDVMTFGSLLLLVFAGLLQAFAIGMIFWSRVHFGSDFNPKIWTEFQTGKSSQSISEALHLDVMQKAREQARMPVKDQVAMMLERASLELENARARQRTIETETRLVESEGEKQAQHWMQLSEESWVRGAFDEAIRHLQTAVQSATGYLPAIKKLAGRFEERGDLEQARFQWEKLEGTALPGSVDMNEALEHLRRLVPVTASHLTAPLRDLTPAKGAVVGSAVPQTPSAFLSLIEVKQTDLSLDDLYDLRFNLRFTLGSRGGDPSIEITQTKLEVTFYDQSVSAGGSVIPLQILSTTLQPKQSWRTGSQQMLSLNYTVPQGYLRKRTELFGSGYRFCGYVVRLFYRGQLQDSYAQPANPLAAFAH